jgi:hypothetical protein
MNPDERLRLLSDPAVSAVPTDVLGGRYAIERQIGAG